MASAAKVQGFPVPCPHCGAPEALSVAVHDLHLTCTSCDEEVTRSDLEKLIEDARRLIRWLDAAATV